MQKEDLEHQGLGMVPRNFMRSVGEFIELDSATIVDFGYRQGTKTLGIAVANKATSVNGDDIYGVFATY